MDADQRRLERVAAALAASPTDDEGGPPSLLAVTSEHYGIQPGYADRPGTEPTDPNATALFEAVVEGAFLVASADGVFDEVEQRAFREVVVGACAGRVAERQLAALLADLGAALSEDGLERRIATVARCVRGPAEAREVMRVAALIAAVSGGVSVEERAVLERLAAVLGLGATEVDLAVAEAQRTIAAPAPPAGSATGAKAGRPPSHPS